MTEQNLRTLVNRLNNGTAKDLIFLRPISDSVDFANVWYAKPSLEDGVSDFGPIKFYFIRDSKDKYVGVVEDRTDDLHWFILSGHRGKGLMKEALQSTILPHLFLDRDEQRITIQQTAIGQKNYLASQNLALNLGFKKTKDDLVSEYALSYHNYQGASFKPFELGISESRIYTLKKEVNFLARRLWLIQNEIEMNLPDADYAEDLKELVKEVQKQPIRMEDNWWNCKRMTENGNCNAE